MQLNVLNDLAESHEGVGRKKCHRLFHVLSNIQMVFRDVAVDRKQLCCSHLVTIVIGCMSVRVTDYWTVVALGTLD